MIHKVKAVTNAFHRKYIISCIFSILIHGNGFLYSNVITFVNMFYEFQFHVDIFTTIAHHIVPSLNQPHKYKSLKW